MDISLVEIRYYQTRSKQCPFRQWLDSLDGQTRKRADARLTRLERGHFGDTEPIGGGVFELKLDVGPGYRIYFGRAGQLVVILLCAGDKKGQSADIRKAQILWRDYLRRTER